MMTSELLQESVHGRLKKVCYLLFFRFPLAGHSYSYQTSFVLKRGVAVEIEYFAEKRQDLHRQVRRERHDARSNSQVLPC
jgi:hypothetical protein